MLFYPNDIITGSSAVKELYSCRHSLFNTKRGSQCINNFISSPKMNYV